jgi:RHS repeat-associated protein
MKTSTLFSSLDGPGKQVAEVSSSGVWNRGEVYAGNRHLATYTGGTSGATYFNTGDWLGTERMRTGLTSVVETCTSLPFGDGQSCTGSETSPVHFTGQQLDTETNLSHMDFRSLSTTQGRWTSMDPAGKAATNPTNPQSWNLYAYVRNSPLTLTDPTGLEGVGQQWGRSLC